MPFDTLIANAGRLRILTTLAAEGRQEFVDLRRRTTLTDGNLSAHAKRLQSAGLVEIEKAFRDGKPFTTFLLTDDGRRRLTQHVAHIMQAIGASEAPSAPRPSAPTAMLVTADEDWVD